MSSAKPESSWYGELFAIHRLKIAAARLMLQESRENNEAFVAALYGCHEIGLTDEILLERLKI